MLKLNVGSCDLPLPKPWINIDISTSPHIRADLILDCRKLDDQFQDNSVDEIYAGHFLEHLTPDEAAEWVSMCYRLLKPGGVLGVVTPDFRFVVQQYLEGKPGFDMAELIDTYIFSYKQESLHRTIWDVDSMQDLFLKHGFTEVTEINRIDDPRLAYPADWQCGVQGVK